MVKGSLLILLGILIAVLMVGIIIFAFSVDRYSPDIKALWPTVQGIVIHSYASEDSPNDRAPTVMYGLSDKDWTVMVSFEYEVNGIHYSNYQMWSETESQAQRQVLVYSPGTNATVRYNPDKPAVAVVDPAGVVYNWGDRILLPILVGIPGLVFAISVLSAGLAKLKNRVRSA
jgi:hypothetical protein